MSEIKEGDKLYVIIRSDLTKAQIAVQAGHSLVDFMIRNFERGLEWNQKSNHLAYLEIESKEKLKELLQKAQDKNIKCGWFNESDMNDELTAIVLDHSNKTRKLCYNLKLALKE